MKCRSYVIPSVSSKQISMSSSVASEPPVGDSASAGMPESPAPLSEIESENAMTPQSAQKGGGGSGAGSAIPSKLLPASGSSHDASSAGGGAMPTGLPKMTSDKCDIRRATFIAGKSSHVQASSGLNFIDCVSRDVILGHGNAKILEAISRQTLTSNLGALNANTTEMTKRLSALLPGQLTACFLVNSQSEANDLALSIALCFTGSEEVRLLAMQCNLIYCMRS